MAVVRGDGNASGIGEESKEQTQGHLEEAIVYWKRKNSGLGARRRQLQTSPVFSLLCDFGQVTHSPSWAQFSPSVQWSRDEFIFALETLLGSRIIDLLGFHSRNHDRPKKKNCKVGNSSRSILVLVHFPPLGGACACPPQGPSVHTRSASSPLATLRKMTQYSSLLRYH